MHIILSNKSDKPIYAQIVEQLKEQIISGKILQGKPLPSIRALASELRISVITTKRAYEELEREGYIETVPGKGSFVAEQNREMVKEAYLKTIEENLIEAIRASRVIKLSLHELKEILEYIYDEE